jgi:hypothetical protein
MTTMKTLIVLVLAAAGAAATASAQEAIPDPNGSTETLYIGRDGHHRTVIFYNPRRMAALQPQTRTFFIERERGHIALHYGDYRKPRDVEEYEANLFAVDHLRGAFCQRDWLIVLADLDRYPAEEGRMLARILRSEGLL